MTATMEAVQDGPDYQAGEFKVGDRVRIITNAVGHRGALAKVIRIDPEGTPLPVVVRLDVDKKPVTPGPLADLGYPFSASEVEAV